AVITAPSRWLSFDITSGHFGNFVTSSRFQRMVLPVLACLTSVIAWSGHTVTIPVALLFFPLLGVAGTRRAAYVTSIAYYAGATWQIVPGAATFFGHHANPMQVLGLWAGVSLLLAAP